VTNASDTAAVICRRPAWARHSEFNDDTETVSGIRHEWTSPSVARISIGSNDDVLPTTVALVQYDDMAITDEGVVTLAVGKPVLFLHDFDAAFTDLSEARSFAAASLECCDQFENPKADPPVAD
jgi:hypothetical protein